MGLTGLWLLFAPTAAHGAPERFARFSTQPTRLYAGQLFDLTLAIYITGDTLDKSITISGMPPPNALHCNPFQELPVQQEAVEDRLYEVRRFRARSMAPAAGPLVIAPTLQGTLLRETRSYFFVQRQTFPTAFSTEPFVLTILPLPTQGCPPTFSGAIGDFRLVAKASPVDIAVGDLVTIEVVIEGIGLPEALTPPTLPPVNGVKAYEVKPVPAEDSASTRTFRQTVVPTDPSVSALPALSFTFFNPRTSQYETKTVGPFPLTFHAERAPIQSVYTPRTNATSTPPPQPPNTVSPEIWKRFLLRFVRTPAEQINVPRDTEVRLAPTMGAIVLFTLKYDTAAKVESRSEDWTRIESPEGTGWIHTPPGP
jgi:hypothetical protein